MGKIDLTYIESISGGDKEFTKEMLNMFLTGTFPEIAILEAQAHAKDWNMVASTAHKIKAPIQMLGVQHVSDMIVEIEHIAKNQANTEQAVHKITILKGNMQDLETQIREYLAS